MNDSTAKHTPGPWEAEGTFVRTLRGAELDGFLVAECPTDSINYAANAVFIAAAPETAAERDMLKKALQEIAQGVTPIEQHGHYLAHQNAVKIARNALAKAHTVTTTEGG